MAIERCLDRRTHKVADGDDRRGSWHPAGGHCETGRCAYSVLLESHQLLVLHQPAVASPHVPPVWCVRRRTVWPSPPPPPSCSASFPLATPCVMSSDTPRPYVPAAVAPLIEAAQHLCRSACADGGGDFSIALLVKRGSSSPLVVFASGLSPQCDVATRKRLKAAAGMFFLSLPTPSMAKPAVPRHPVTGLLWSSSAPPANMLAAAQPSASLFSSLPRGSASTPWGGLPPASPPPIGGSSMGTVAIGNSLSARGGTTGGGGGGDAGMRGDRASGGGTTDGRAGGASENPSGGNIAAGDAAFVGGGGDPAPGGTVAANGGASGIAAERGGVNAEIPESIAATGRYAELPPLPAFIGTKAVVGKRARGALVPSTSASPPPTTCTWDVTPEAAASFKARLADAGLRITRKHLVGLTLLKYCYDVRLNRVGRNTPYEPLFPIAAVGVTVNLQHVDAVKGVVPIPLVLENVSYQQKNATCSLLLYMLYKVGDDAYDWVLSRYCEGMRAHQPSPTAGAPRRSSAHKPHVLMGDTAGTATKAAAAAAAGTAESRQGQRASGGALGSSSVVGPAVPLGRARYFPSPCPALLPRSTIVYEDGQELSTCDVHLEFEQHHGTLLPPNHVSIILRTAKDLNVRYPMDTHASFCVDREFPEEMLLTRCINQRLVWQVKNIGYVIIVFFWAIVAFCSVCCALVLCMRTVTDTHSFVS